MVQHAPAKRWPAHAAAVSAVLDTVRRRVLTYLGLPWLWGARPGPSCTLARLLSTRLPNCPLAGLPVRVDSPPPLLTFLTARSPFYLSTCHAPARTLSSGSPTSPDAPAARWLCSYEGHSPGPLMVGARVVLRVAAFCTPSQLARSYTFALTLANVSMVRSSAASSRRALTLRAFPCLPSVHRARKCTGCLWLFPHVSDRAQALSRLGM